MMTKVFFFRIGLVALPSIILSELETWKYWHWSHAMKYNGQLFLLLLTFYICFPKNMGLGMKFLTGSSTYNTILCVVFVSTTYVANIFKTYHFMKCISWNCELCSKFLKIKQNIWSELHFMIWLFYLMQCCHTTSLKFRLRSADIDSTHFSLALALASETSFINFLIVMEE